MALVLVLICLPVMLILGYAFLASSSTSVATADNMHKHLRARAISDSGLNATMRYTELHTDWPQTHGEGTWTQEQPFGGGTFTIEAEKVGEENGVDVYRLRATGRYEGVAYQRHRLLPASVAQAVAVGVATSGSLSASDSRVDSFDSSQGPYGGENVGDEAVLKAGMDLPGPVDWPEGMPPNEGDYELDGGIHFIDSDRHFDEMEVEDGAILQISGDVRIRVNDDFELDDDSHIELLGDATVSFYVGGDISVEENSSINANTAEPWRVVIYALGGDNITLDDVGAIHAIIDAPQREVEVGNDAHIYGAVMAKSFELDGGYFHHDHNAKLLDGNPRLPVHEAD